MGTVYEVPAKRYLFARPPVRLMEVPAGHVCAMALLLCVEAMTVKEAQQFLTAPEHFAFQTFRELVKTRKGVNTLLSVRPLVRGLALLYEASAGSTEKQLMKSVGFPDDHQVLRKAHLVIDNAVKAAVGPKGIFKTATRLFVDSKIDVLPAYERLLEDFYSAGIERLNFGNIHTAADRVNWWTKIRTNHTVSSIITAEDMTAMLHSLFMISTLYYRGHWRVPFHREDTKPRLFHVTPEDAIEVAMMSATGEFRVKRCTKRQGTLISIPYEGSRLVMIVVLPDVGRTTDDFLSEELHWPEERIMADVEPEVCEVMLPRFFVETKVYLKNPSHKLGLHKLFTSAANLTNLSPDSSLGLDNIVQLTKFQVTEEEGSSTSAVSQSAGIFRKTGEMQQVVVDRPFLFYILDEDLNMPLVFGRVVHPTDL